MVEILFKAVIKEITKLSLQILKITTLLNYINADQLHIYINKRFTYT